MQKYVTEKIEWNESRIRSLEEENNRLNESLEKNKGVKTIERWVGYEFESSSETTPEFVAFVKDLKKHIKSELPEGSELVEFSKGHFYVSGFVKRNSNYVYFSISDVRHFRDSWYDNILIRTAKDEKDYTGGSNNSTSLKEFKKNVDYLLSREVA